MTLHWAFFCLINAIMLLKINLIIKQVLYHFRHSLDIPFIHTKKEKKSMVNLTLLNYFEYEFSCNAIQESQQ